MGFEGAVGCVTVGFGSRAEVLCWMASSLTWSHD